MSLILDALKKADAERTLGQAPGLQAQALPLPGIEGDDGRSGRSVALIGTGVALVLLTVAGAAWWTWIRTSPPPAPAAVVTQAPLAVPAAPPALPTPVAAVAPPAAVPPAPAPALAPAPAAAPAPAPAPTLPVAPKRIEPPTRPTALPEQPRPTPPPAVRPSQASDEAASRPATAAVVPPIETLPEGLRRNLPPMSVGGSIYADRPVDRILIVNGQLLKEGDAIDGRVVLESIGRQSAIWRLGEQRFSTKF